MKPQLDRLLLPRLFAAWLALAWLSCGFAAGTFVLRASAQQYPPGIDWLELNSPNFRVIYPREIEGDAQRVAVTLESIYEQASKTMGVSPARLPVVLNNRGTVSNGYVSLGPRRSVWESTPFLPGVQSLLGTGEWYDLLAVHEYRHVAQFAAVDRGASRLARIAFGDNGLSASAGLAIPAWFWEGDAVGLETTMTGAGRGRMPAFDMHLRAMLREGVAFGYPKSRFRSFRDFVPGHYPYGYVLTTHARRQYGDSVWADIVSDAGSWSFVPLIFPIAVKRRTGRGLHRLHREAMEELDLLWREQREGLKYTGGLRRNTGLKERWTNFAHPHYAANADIVAVQSGLREAADLVLLSPDQSPSTLGSVDPAMYFGGFDANEAIAVWSQSRTNPRYFDEGFSVLMRRDLRSGKTRALTRRSRLFEPAISPANSSGTSMIAAVEISTDRKFGIVVVNAETGAQAFRIEGPEGRFISEVGWAVDGSAIVAVVQDHRGKSIMQISLADYSWKTLIPPGLENIWGIQDGGDVLFYVSDYSGIDNVYARYRDTGETFQVTSRPLGAYFPDVSPDGTRLAFSDYTVDGFDVVEVRLDRGTWTPIDSVVVRRTEYFEPMLAQEDAEVLVPELRRPEAGYPSRRYRRLRDAIRFHSWLPTYDGRAAGLAIESNNLLNTLAVRVGAVYDRREGTVLAATSAIYSGMVPIFTVTGLHGGRTSTFRAAGEDQTYSWLETGARVRMDIPLTFRRGNRATHVTAGISGGWFRVADRDFVPFLDQGNGHFTPVGASLSFSRRFASAFSDFESPRALSIILAAQTTTGRSDYASQKLYGAAAITRRGLGLQHRLRVSGEAEIERPENYQYASILRFSRGYRSRYADNAVRGTVEYALPAAYPDFAIGNWLYTPRIIGTLFYDHTWTDGVRSPFSATGSFRSVGGEVMAEVYLLSVPVPIRVGIRGGYRLEAEDYFVEPVLFSILFE